MAYLVSRQTLPDKCSGIDADRDSAKGSDSVSRPLPARWTLWIGILFLVRAVGLIIGLDRLPMLPSVQPEVIINDPAVALSRGEGLRAPVFEHSLHGLDTLFAHFPPVFVALQSIVFRVFGFSALTLRASSVIADLGAALVFVAILWELYRRRILDRLGWMFGSLLILLEPTMLIHSREARMESLNVLLGGLAIYLCLRADLSGRFGVASWFAAAALIGIALASHPASLLLWAALFIFSLFRFRSLGAIRWLAIHSTPPLVFISIWLATYRAKSLAALRQMREIAAYAPHPSLRLVELTSNVSHGAVKLAQNSGGFALLLTIVALGAGCWRLLSSKKDPEFASGEWQTSLSCSTTIVLVQILLLQLVVPTSGMNRVVMTVHFASVCLALAVSHLRPSGARIVKAGFLVAALLQLTLLGGYLSELRKDWHGRSAQRFDQIVDSLPRGARVVAPPEMWFAFRSRERQVAIIITTLDEERYWKEVPDAFDPYEVVILDPNSSAYPSLYSRVTVRKPDRYVLRSSGRNFVVFATPAILSGLAGQ